MIIFQHFDLLSVGLAAASTVIIGFTVYFSDRNSATNKSFLGFSLVTCVWGIVNYSFYQIGNVDLALMTLRLVLFLAVWQTFFLFQFFFTVPQRTVSFPKWYAYGLMPLVALTSLLVLTPLGFSHVTEIVEGTITEVANGPAMPLFGIVSIGLVFGAMYFLLSKIKTAAGSEKRSLQTILLGALIMFVLIITFNFVFPTLYNDSRFVPLGALFVFPLVIFTSYTILRERFFNVRVAGSALLIFALASATFVEVVLADNILTMMYRNGVLLSVLVFGVLLIRGVMHEVEQRELIERQRKELEEANKEQESLLHFMSHEVKGYFTESEAGFAAIADGDLGKVPNAVRSTAETALSGVRRGVAMIMEILDATNFKKGTVIYKKEVFDFRAAIRDVIEELRPEAEKKGLAIEIAIGEGRFDFQGDEEKLKQHVIRNLLDNAVKYSRSGTICATLTDGETIRFSVKDTGVGITPDDMHHLFTEGGKGKDSIKVNVHSTGYGLFIAKKIVEAHGGRIWAESEGGGKGSMFIVEFPVATG